MARLSQRSGPHEAASRDSAVIGSGRTPRPS